MAKNGLPPKINNPLELDDDGPAMAALEQAAEAARVRQAQIVRLRKLHKQVGDTAEFRAALAELGITVAEINPAIEKRKELLGQGKVYRSAP